MEISDASFEEEITNYEGIVLLDCWSSWCPPCKMMDPMVTRLHHELKDRAKVVKMNIDRNPVMSSELKVQGVPTFYAFKNGVLQEQRTGAQTENQLKAMVSALEDNDEQQAAA